MLAEGQRLVFARLPDTDDELYEAVRALWGVTIPRHQVCPDHVSPFSAFADAYFNRGQSTAVWHGSRGLSGKSFALAILGMTKAVFRGVDVNLLGGSLAQSANIHEHMRAAMDAPNAPRWMMTQEGATLIRLSNNAKIRPLTASQRTVRGPHPPFLLLDEIDEMDIKILDAALGQPMPQKSYLGVIEQPYTVMSSTWQNAEGTFSAIKRRFEERGIPTKQWCYRESANPIDGWLSQETIEDKRNTVPAEMWRVEYELGEPSIGNRAFDSASVEAMFSLPMEPLTQKVAKDYEEYTFAEPIRDQRYVAGADWGKEQDYTVISVFRVMPEINRSELVYFARVNRRPYPLMMKLLNDAVQRYDAQATHDATGLGNVVNDFMDARIRGFVMTGEKRAIMLSEYVVAVENGQIFSPKIPSAYLETKYATYGDLYSGAKAQGFHLPDTVCSFALAYHVARKYIPAASPITVGRKPDSNRYAKIFEMPVDGDPLSPGRSGDVHSSKDRGTDLSLLV